MNLSKLYVIQNDLKKHIGYKGEDKFSKMMLGMMVEFMECANDWRGFKYWSQNNEPKTSGKVECAHCAGRGEFDVKPEHSIQGEKYRYCKKCDGVGFIGTNNPLLEEYVDGLHLILEAGLDLLEMRLVSRLPEEVEAKENATEATIEQQYKTILSLALQLDTAVALYGNLVYFRYVSLFTHYMALGQMLGFTEQEIHDAYLVKNEINHERQENNY